MYDELLGLKVLSTKWSETLMCGMACRSCTINDFSKYIMFAYQYAPKNLCTREKYFVRRKFFFLLCAVSSQSYNFPNLIIISSSLSSLFSRYLFHFTTFNYWILCKIFPLLSRTWVLIFTRFLFLLQTFFLLFQRRGCKIFFFR
jgi:hypothetical protein